MCYVPLVGMNQLEMDYISYFNVVFCQQRKNKILEETYLQHLDQYTSIWVLNACNKSTLFKLLKFIDLIKNENRSSWGKYHIEKD